MGTPKTICSDSVHTESIRQKIGDPTGHSHLPARDQAKKRFTSWDQKGQRFERLRTTTKQWATRVVPISLDLRLSRAWSCRSSAPWFWCLVILVRRLGRFDLGSAGSAGSAVRARKRRLGIGRNMWLWLSKPFWDPILVGR